MFFNQFTQRKQNVQTSAILKVDFAKESRVRIFVNHFMIYRNL